MSCNCGDDGCFLSSYDLGVEDANFIIGFLKTLLEHEGIVMEVAIDLLKETVKNRHEINILMASQGILSAQEISHGGSL